MDTVAGETTVDMEVYTLDARDAQNLALNISDKEFLNNDQNYQSLLETQQSFTVIRITVNLPTDEHFQRLLKIFEKFGSRIEKLLFEQNGMRLEQYATLLNLLLNLKQLVIRKLSVIELMEEVDVDSFKLPKLTTLVVENCDFSIRRFIMNIPRNVLREFITDNDRIRNLDIFYGQQMSLMKLKTSEKLTLRMQKLTHLSFEPWIDIKVKVVDFICDQPNLIFLEVTPSYRMIDQYCIMTNIFSAACKLKELRVLKIDIEFVAFRGIENIKDMINLRELQLSSDCIEPFNNYASLSKLKEVSKFVQLTKLTLILPNTVLSDEILIAIGRHLTQLETFSLKAKFFSLDVVPKWFLKLTSFEAIYMNSEPKIESYYNGTESGKLQFLKLEQFKLNIIEGRSKSFSSPGKFLELLKTFPNIKNLEVAANFTFADLIPQLFTLAPHLTTLHIMQSQSLHFNTVIMRRMMRQVLCKANHLQKFIIESKARNNFYIKSDVIKVFESKFKAITFSEDCKQIMMMQKQDMEIWKSPFDEPC